MLLSILWLLTQYYPIAAQLLQAPQCNNTCHKNFTFLWRLERRQENSTKTTSDGSVHFFGTIHVPYSLVWPYVSLSTKEAFLDAQSIFFELDLTDPYTISNLADCQFLPNGQNLFTVLPRKLYQRIRKYLQSVKQKLPRWVRRAQRDTALQLFHAITRSWKQKRPVWIILLLNSLTEAELKHRTDPVLDLFLAQEAARYRKKVGAIERADEQCQPLNEMDKLKVIFVLNQTLNLLESGAEPTSSNTLAGSDQLICHYLCGSLDSAILNTDKLPKIVNVVEGDSNEVGVEAREINDYFREKLIYERNERMAKRVAQILQNHRNERFFFAIGAGHFFGERSLLHYLEEFGYTAIEVNANSSISRPSSFEADLAKPTSRPNTAVADQSFSFLQFISRHVDTDKRPNALLELPSAQADLLPETKVVDQEERTGRRVRVKYEGISDMWIHVKANGPDEELNSAEQPLASRAWSISCSTVTLAILGVYSTF